MEMSGGRGGTLNVDKGATQNFSVGLDSECNPTHTVGSVFTGTSGYSGNRFRRTGQYGGDFLSEVALRITSDTFGPPAPLGRFPDGMIIHQALAEISAAGLTRSFTYATEPILDCDGETVLDPGINPDFTADTSLTDVAYTVLGFIGADEFEVVGSIEGGANGQRVVDITDLIQVMYDDRSIGKYAYGYGIVFSPVGLLDGAEDIAGLLIPEGPTRERTVCPGLTCAGSSYLEYYTHTIEDYSWTNISIDKVMLKIEYPESSKQYQLPGPRWPSFKALPVPE